MESLLAGYRRFRAGGWPARKRLFEHLAEHGQHPETAVIACADSRVDPAMIFDAGPGEMFVLRNVANLVPPSAPDGAAHGTSAGLEFAVLSLKVRHLLVLGHGLCGGVRALRVGETSGVFLGPWLRQAAPALREALLCAPADAELAAEHAVVGLSLANLLTFPFIAERVAAGTLDLIGAHFDIRTGILALRAADGRFLPVA
jgi:carbonic anhydrase